MKKLIILMMLISACVSTQAQKHRRVKRPVIKVETEPSPEEKLYASMLPSTAKIMFIDSLVVDRDSFLTKIPLNKESGEIMSYNKFFNKAKKTSVMMSVYINEFGDQAYYAEEDTVRGNKLYRLDWLGEKWGKRTKVEGIDSAFHQINYPFVLSDGITLFFSAKGANSVGGYDIFTTTFDSDSGKFYEPQNYGFPFNSTANDYFLAIDEYDNIGWLVSDRNQPEGKVCIYTFIPPTLRKSFEEDDLTEDELKKYANIQSIADTWKFGNRAEGLQKKANLLERQAAKSSDEYFSFVINDKLVYHRLDNFKSKANRQQFLMLNGQKALYRKKMEELDKMRLNYESLSKGQKAKVSTDIINKEQETEQLLNTITETEKRIRNSENKLINR